MEQRNEGLNVWLARPTAERPTRAGLVFPALAFSGVIGDLLSSPMLPPFRHSGGLSVPQPEVQLSDDATPDHPPNPD